jgi:glycosyltransferase involved in cell wall biosynthesis
MKIAIIHDDLMRRGGAEKVALSLLKAFPEADFYTLCYKPELTYEEYSAYKVNTSWYQKLAFSEASMKLMFYPFGVWAMKSLNLEAYDLVIISTTFCAKYIKLNPKAKLVTYCHTPFRLAWFPETYNKISRDKLLKFLMFRIVCPHLRSIDRKYALRTNFFIANSKVTLERIADCYTKDIPTKLLHPPVDLSHFRTSESAKDYYLVVSRFQPYKKIDLVIQVFNQLVDKKLVIVGTGILEKELKAMANDNIEFKGSVSSSELANLYANCKALIFPQIEDFGITPLEANACGRPVIAFNRGGVLETMVPFEKEGQPFSALFFNEQSELSLKKAILDFEKIESHIDVEFIYSNARRFSEKNFVKKIRQMVVESFHPLPEYSKTDHKKIPI